MDSSAGDAAEGGDVPMPAVPSAEVAAAIELLRYMPFVVPFMKRVSIFRHFVDDHPLLRLGSRVRCVEGAMVDGS